LRPKSHIVHNSPHRCAGVQGPGSRPIATTPSTFEQRRTDTVGGRGIAWRTYSSLLAAEEGEKGLGCANAASHALPLVMRSSGQGGAATTTGPGVDPIAGRRSTAMGMPVGVVGDVSVVPPAPLAAPLASPRIPLLRSACSSHPSSASHRALEKEAGVVAPLRAAAPAPPPPPPPPPAAAAPTAPASAPEAVDATPGWENSISSSVMQPAGAPLGPVRTRASAVAGAPNRQWSVYSRQEPSRAGGPLPTGGARPAGGWQ
jgi:hypothetical protein